MSAQTPRSAVRMAYLVSAYPAISHTFILREVLQLRAKGFEIHVASINAPDRPAERLTEDERAEDKLTLYVKQQGAARGLAAVLRALATRPLALVRALAFAVRLGHADVKKQLYGIFYLVEAAIIGRFMEERALTHLHVHFATPASTVGLILTKLYPATLSLTVHGPDEFYDAPGYCLTEKIEGASFVCTIGRYAKSQCMKLSDPAHWEKLEVAPLGVDPALFTPRAFREQPDPFEVLCVGRLVPAKGQHVLLRAIARLAGEGRRVRLRVVGDGPDRAALERFAAERGLGEHVVFEGAVNQDRIRALYAQADVFALASFAEGIPVVLMEAMAMEIPCVTTFITGHPELIRDGVDGLLVAPSDDEELARAIARLMDDAALRRTLGEAGRRRVIERYNLAPNTERLAEIFRRRLAEQEPVAR